MPQPFAEPGAARTLGNGVVLVLQRGHQADVTRHGTADAEVAERVVGVDEDGRHAGGDGADDGVLGADDVGVADP
jgi:hypothetical protein